MKKIAALLIAGVLSVGIVSLAACGNNPEGEAAEGFHLPQIPEGVKLSDVNVTDAVDTEAQLFEKRNASNSVIQDQYTYLKETYYNKDDGKESRIYETDTIINVKYLNKDGKIYGENNRHSILNDKDRYFDGERKEEIDTMAFIQDGSIGMLRRGDYYTNGSNGETQDTLPLYLAGYTVNGVGAVDNDYFNGIRLLAYSVNNESLRNDLPYSAEHVFVDTEYKLTRYQDYTKLCYFMANEIPVQYDAKVKNYKSTFKADGTKMYFEYSYRLEFTEYNGDKVYSWEYKYATYLDTDAGLKESDFKDDYITDDVLKDTYYYDCDEKQVAADFAAGKEIVINPVGGADVSGVSFSYEERFREYLSPYILFVDGDNRIQGLIAGYVDNSHAKVENGKVIINSDGALEIAKKYAEERMGIDFAAVDLENAKMYLVVNADASRDVEEDIYILSARELYIPLN